MDRTTYCAFPALLPPRSVSIPAAVFPAGISHQLFFDAARLAFSRFNLVMSAKRLHSSLELNETAYLLGYEDAHSFFRAFHGWEGSPPGEWRARHARSTRSRQTAATA